MCRPTDTSRLGVTLSLFWLGVVLGSLLVELFVSFVHTRQWMTLATCRLLAGTFMLHEPHALLTVCCSQVSTAIAIAQAHDQHHHHVYGSLTCAPTLSKPDAVILA